MHTKNTVTGAAAMILSISLFVCCYVYLFATLITYAWTVQDIEILFVPYDRALFF